MASASSLPPQESLSQDAIKTEHVPESELIATLDSVETKEHEAETFMETVLPIQPLATEPPPENKHGFKVPTFTAQDLLLIRDLIGPINTVQPTPPLKVETVDDVESSEDGHISEGEAVPVEIKADAPTTAIPSDSDSEGSDSDSDTTLSSDDEADKRQAALDSEDDEESGGKKGKQFENANELPEVDIIIPEIEEVGPDDQLEKIGEIMTIMDKLVIIKGMETGRGFDAALDADTLLVFDDRKVLGYVYETFGPTAQPFYQVKFNQKYPLNLEKVRLQREVFHAPRHSRFVSMREILRLKGSDASNVNDEEPGDDELEFSDDEAEAAHKSRFKRKRSESRAGSVAAASRQSTPYSSREQDDSIAASSMYSRHGPYDMDIGAGPSRPAPIPYDDPYADTFHQREPSEKPETSESSSNERPPFRESSRGRGRGRGRGRDEPREGRGRGRNNNNRGSARPQRSNSQAQEAANIPRPLSPTSLAIARATGQYSDGSNFAVPSPNMNPFWQFQQFQPSPGFSGGQVYQNPQQYVQPHINPRFASAFRMFQPQQMQQQPQAYSPFSSLGKAQQSQPPPPAGSDPVASSWTDEWTVHGGDSETNT